MSKKTILSKLAALLILIFICSGINAQDTHVYVSAHPDDWQLFMNPNAYHSLQNPENKVIFLHTTAGDAGQGMGYDGYYLAREEGSLRAIRFLCNSLVADRGLGNSMMEETVQINGHSIKKFTYANSVSYFLRLPDGNYTGPGYPIHNNLSLRKLVEGSIRGINAIDGSTSYVSLEDLKTTIKMLLENEKQGSLNLNIADTDEERNPADHSDHLNTSLIMQAVAQVTEVASIRLYEEYSTQQKPPNVFDADFLISAGCWGATASGLSDMNHNSTWNEGHNVWIGRQYFTHVSIESGKDK